MTNEQEPNESSGDPLERWIEALAGTDLWAEEKSLAAIGNCPDPRELADLERGRIVDEKRRDALARHLVTCPNCIDANLHALLEGAAPAIPTPFGVVSQHDEKPSAASNARPAWSASLLPALSLAAAFLVAATSWLAIEAPARHSYPIAGIHPTDASGFETRGPAPDPTDPLATRRRVSIDVRATGFVSLVRATRESVGLASAPIEILPVAGSAFATTVESGEEVILPLDGSIPCAKGDTWLVLFSERELPVGELRDAASRLLQGYHVAGIDAVRVVPRP